MEIPNLSRFPLYGVDHFRAAMVEPNDKGDAIKDLTSELNDSQNKEVSCTKPVSN